MASYYSPSEIFEFQADAIQFAKWNENEVETDFVSHAKKATLKALNEELTEKQKRYFTLYHINRTSIEEIAKLEGVNKSTVSRTLTRARKKMSKVLRYTAPYLLNEQAETRNRRV